MDKVADKLKALMPLFLPDLADWAVGLSFADVARVANDVLKDALVGRRERIREEEIRAVIDERKAVSNKLAVPGA